MLKSTLWHCSDGYILVKGRITLIGQGADEAAIQADINNKPAPFTGCITEINNTQVDNLEKILKL